MSQLAAVSGLSTVKRDWDDSKTSSSSFLSSQPVVAVGGGTTPAIKRAPMDPEARAKRIAKMQAALDEAPSSSTATSAKRVAPVELGEGPPAKKRSLPWGDGESAPDASSSSSSTAVASKDPHKVFLSPEQQQILKLVMDGKNIFFTGSAGTGKSVLLREIIRTLKKKYARSVDAVAITASTGIAACNIGGVTLHSFAGIGIGEGTAENLAGKVRKNKKAAGRWLRTQVLIIDEVSMVDGDLFDKLARIASIIKKTTKPFGGIQIVVTGDFFQLPPVTRTGQPTFAFEAEMWKDCVERTFNLTKVFRQKDQDFVDMLNEMRFGRLTTKSIQKFKALSRPIVYDDGLIPTELFPRREDVEKSNGLRIAGLDGTAESFHAIDGGSITDRDARAKLLSNMMAPAFIQLKLNSQVMLIKNMDETLVNGSMGIVQRFEDATTYKQTGGIVLNEDYVNKAAKAGKEGGQKFPVVRFPITGTNMSKDVLITPEVWKVELPSGEVQASRTQLPLILAWAMSIHKSQGQTLDRVKVDLGRVFEKGQAYVALSRATSLQGLQVLGFDHVKVAAHPKVTKWSQTLETINQ